MMEFETFITYDKWANERVFTEAKKINKSETSDEIRKLFAHLLSAQIIWCKRILGEEIKQEIWPDLSLQKIEMMINENPILLKKALKDPNQEFIYKNSKGSSFKNTVGEISTHLTIHGQHHRAQIATLMRKAGIAPPATDFIVFIRE